MFFRVWKKLVEIKPATSLLAKINLDLKKKKKIGSQYTLLEVGQNKL